MTALSVSAADEPVPTIGIVIMHGKGGSPNKNVSELASSLARQGYAVANIEMPWSGRRNYDVDMTAAEKEVASALEALRSKGAKKLFVAGHSQGGMFALHYGARHPVDGVIAIAPGASVGSPVFQEKLGASLAEARELIDKGKGNEIARLADYEGAKGAYPIATRPVAYLTWFDPNGGMNDKASLRKMPPSVPVLLIVPTNDYPGLQELKRARFDALPSHPMTQLYEPASSHGGAPSASIDEIARWTARIAGSADAR